MPNVIKEYSGLYRVDHEYIGRRLVDYDITGHAATAVQPAPSPVGTLIWQDEFDGAAGTPPDSTKWNLLGDAYSQDMSAAPPKNANAFHDGLGHLVLRTQREPGGWRGENGQYDSTRYPTAPTYSGAFIASALYGSGWPMSTTGRKGVFTLPFRIEVMSKYPNMPGGWGGGWSMSVNKSLTQGVTEIDFSESRMAVPFEVAAHQHWTGDTGGWSDSNHKSIDLRVNWTRRSYALWTTGTYAFRPMYYVNDTLIDIGPQIRNAPNYSGAVQTDVIFEAQFDWRLAPPFTWGSGSTTSSVEGTNYPLSTDNGPWDTLYEYVRVFDLSGVAAP